MNGHIVPKTYLKSWRKDDSNIFVFQNNDYSGDGRLRNLKLQRSSFTGKDKYIIEPSVMFNNTVFTPEFKRLFESMKDFNMECNGNKIKSVNDFMSFYPEFNNWKITDKEGKCLSSKNEQLRLRVIWDEQVATVIEDYFSVAIENKWSCFLFYLNSHILQRNYMVQAKYKDILIEFTAVQICRIFERITSLGINPTLEILKPLLFNELPRSIKSHINNKVFDDDFRNSVCLTQLFLYTKYAKTKCADYENNVATRIISLLNGMQPIILVATGKKRFITSDCPSYHINLAMKYPKEFTGIYLPLTPQACAYFVKLSDKTKSNKYYIVDVDDDNVGFVNYMTIKSSVSSVAYCEKHICDIIQKVPNINSWKQGLLSVGIAHV